MAASPHCAVAFVETPGASSTGFSTAGASIAIRLELLTRAVTAAALGEFLPGTCRESGVFLAMRRVRGEARVSLLKVDAAEAFAERGLLLFVGAVVQLAVQQPRALELGNVQQFDELGAHFGQAEGRRQVRDVQPSDLSRCRMRR